MCGSRDERGVVFPSPVVILSVIAVAMAGVAFVATRDGAPTEREITTISEPADHSATATPSSDAAKPSPKPKKPDGRPLQGLRRRLQQLQRHRPRRPGRRAGQPDRLAGGRLRQLVRHHPGLDRLLPEAARGGRQDCSRSTSASSAPRRRSTRCGSTGSP